jgi:hypothetical protein
MNFEWNRIAERGQTATGYIDVYELMGRQKAIAVIHYMPQHEFKKQLVVLTLILEGTKSSWTDGTIDRIFQDAEFRIKNVWFEKFNNYNELKLMYTQLFTVKSIQDFDYLSHGDMSFIDG